eukprot:10791817-Alexandrium_andersonii.AAC.1
MLRFVDLTDPPCRFQMRGFDVQEAGRQIARLKPFRMPEMPKAASAKCGRCREECCLQHVGRVQHGFVCLGVGTGNST